MIVVAKTKIMIVPGFGIPADDKAMATLKKTIESQGEYMVKIVDLPTLVRAEHEGEELTEPKIIELSASKLEQLSTCSGLRWDGTDNVDNYLAGLKRETIKSVFKITKIYGDGVDECDAPDAIVVFGKSAMLAGGVGKTNVLFINPKYDSEWPWKKQYYADQQQAGQYHCDKYDYESRFMETVLWTGTECTSPWRYFRRFGLITDEDYLGAFWDRYPRHAEVNCDLDGDTAGLAKFICEFADNELTYPLEEVYEAIQNLPGRGLHNLSRICDFIDPVKLDNITARGIRFGAPMANGQSGYKLKVAEGDHT
ncbi:MAG: hypothetical protein K2L34_01725, partial [Muribaculaceae bacterium]|nr:hypothetical protein [Muribaculaceae bacterium]